jgi:hypothetical protein
MKPHFGNTIATTGRSIIASRFKKPFGHVIGQDLNALQVDGELVGLHDSSPIALVFALVDGSANVLGVILWIAWSAINRLSVAIAGTFGAQ